MATSYPAPGTSSQSTLSEWAGPYVTGMLGQAQALSQLPYQTYQGPMTAGPSSLQQQYFGGLGSLGFPSRLGQSFMGQQTDAMGKPVVNPMGQPITNASAYMNPYMQQVLQPQLQAMQRQADIQKSQLGAQLAKSGAFGGARAGLMGSQLASDLMRQQQQATGQAYGQAFQQAMQQFNTEQQQAQQLANMLAGAGATQRDIEQQGITADLDEFNRQREYPYKQLQFQRDMISGLPISSVTNTPAQLSGIGSLITAAGGLDKFLKDSGVGDLKTLLGKLGFDFGSESVLP